MVSFSISMLLKLIYNMSIPCHKSKINRKMFPLIFCYFANLSATLIAISLTEGGMVALNLTNKQKKESLPK